MLKKGSVVTDVHITLRDSATFAYDTVGKWKPFRKCSRCGNRNVHQLLTHLSTSYRDRYGKTHDTRHVEINGTVCTNCGHLHKDDWLN